LVQDMITEHRERTGKAAVEHLHRGEQVGLP
jgi:hypothetical protein